MLDNQKINSANIPQVGSLENKENISTEPSQQFSGCVGRLIAENISSLSMCITTESVPSAVAKFLRITL